MIPIRKKKMFFEKVFFKECAKEEEKRIFNGSTTIYPLG